MKATFILNGNQATDVEIRSGLDAFFYIDEGKEIVLAIDFIKGKPVLIIDKRNCSETQVLIEENSQATYLLENGKIKGKEEAQQVLIERMEKSIKGGY